MMTFKKIHTNLLKTIPLLVCAFILLYQPNIVPSNQNVTIIISLVLTVLIFLFTVTGTLTNIVFSNIGNFTCVILGSMYVLFRALVADQETRLIQNLYVLVIILGLCEITSILGNSLDFSREKIFSFFLNVSTLQLFITVAMLLSSSIRTRILSFANLALTSNQFIVGVRIYGYSGDYTFFIPIFHSMLIVIAVQLAISKSWRYLLYVPGLLLMIMLNGRTGLLTTILGVISLLLMNVIGNFELRRSTIKVIFGGLLVCLPIYIIVMEILPDSTLNWMQQGINDVWLYLTQGKTDGNMAVLAGNFLFFPKGWSLLFGAGLRVYGHNAENLGYAQSDIGYVNDLFLGGIIYITILYFGQFYFLSRRILRRNRQGIRLFLSLLLILVVANYKGEAMRSGTIIAFLVVVTFVLTNFKSTSEDR